MSLAPLLILPAVGGFAFCTIFKLTRYRIARQDGHRLYFSVIWYALFLAVVSAEIHTILFSYFDSYRIPIDTLSVEIWKNGHEEMFGSASITAILVGTVLWGPVVAFILNLMFYAEQWNWLPKPIAKKSEIFHRYILDDARKHDYVEQLIVQAMELGMPLMVTLQSGKVYVGFSLGLMDPTETRKSFKLLPMMSGYRNEEHKVKFTTEYIDAIDQTTEKDPNNAKELFAIVIEADQVCTTRMFDIEIYAKHFTPSPGIA